MHPLDFNDLMLEHGYDVRRAYGRSKLAQTMSDFALAEHLPAGEVNSLHPATVGHDGALRDRAALRQPRSRRGVRLPARRVAGSRWDDGRLLRPDKARVRARSGLRSGGARRAVAAQPGAHRALVAAG
ncbi:hypothetical protein GCM10009834_10840 [Streptomonospora arabica]